jgi:hypothetical protein
VGKPLLVACTIEIASAEGLDIEQPQSGTSIGSSKRDGIDALKAERATVTDAGPARAEAAEFNGGGAKCNEIEWDQG